MSPHLVVKHVTRSASLFSSWVTFSAALAPNADSVISPGFGSCTEPSTCLRNGCQLDLACSHSLSCIELLAKETAVVGGLANVPTVLMARKSML